MKSFIALLLAIVPQTEAVTDHVDCIELNRVYDENANHTFTQVIFWETNREGIDVVIDWRLVKHANQLPSDRSVIWRDGDRIRKVIANHSMETWTQYDPELAARSERPTEQRRGLGRRVIRDFYKEQ